MAIKGLKILTFFCLLIISTKILAKQADTLLIYEYVHITDTIWIESELEFLKTNTVALNSNQLGEKNTQIELLHGKNIATITKYDIILSNKQHKNDDMRTITFLGLTFIALNSTAFSQNDFENTLGIYLKGNMASQTFLEYYVTNSLPTLGFGIQYEHFFNYRFSLVSNAGYLLRGTTERKALLSHESYPSCGTFILTELPAPKNRFHNASADISFKWRNKKNSYVNPYLYSGLRFDYTLSRRIEYKIGKGQPFDRAGYKHFNNFTYGLILGTGISIKQRFYIEIEANNDIGYLVNNDIMQARNLLFSLNLGYKFAGFKRDAH